MSCNGILRKGETVCFTCGDGAPKQRNRKPFAQRFSLLITLIFLASLALTVASFVFTDRTPPFTACLAASVILLFVKRSADQVAGKRT
jgi:hypothetical protein